MTAAVFALLLAWWLACCQALGHRGAHPSEKLLQLPSRSELDALLEEEKAGAVLTALAHVEEAYGTLLVDDQLPSFYTYKGVALFETNRIQDAVQAFQQAVTANPAELRAWINLIHTLPILGESNEEAIQKVEALSAKPFIIGRFDSAFWLQLEEHLHRHELSARRCLQARDESICDGNSLAQAVTNVDDPRFLREMNELFWDFYLQHRNATATATTPAAVATPPPSTAAQGAVFTIGIILNRMEAGPVQVLAQGFFERLGQRPGIRLVAFLMDSNHRLDVPWVRRLFSFFHHFVSLDGLDAQAAAQAIREEAVEALLEMNGAGLHSGLNLLSFRPAPLQASFLGDPYSLGSPFVDLFLSDAVASPPEVAHQTFTERLGLLSTSYMLSSHADWQPTVLHTSRWPRTAFSTALERPVAFSPKEWTKKVLLGSFHGRTKVDPVVFAVWMNILRRAPTAYLVLSSSRGAPAAGVNRLNQVRAHGVSIDRVNFLKQLPWDAHLHVKTALDLFLDTVIKNGHSTTVDAVYAGLPVVALAGMQRTAARSSQSIAHFLDCSEGMVSSLKEYEDRVVSVISTEMGRQQLRAWRRKSERRRRQTSLFDVAFQTEAVVHLLEAAVDLRRLSDCSAGWKHCEHLRRRAGVYEELGGRVHFHVFSPL